MPLFGRSGRSSNAAPPEPTEIEQQEPPSYLDARLAIFRELEADGSTPTTPTPARAIGRRPNGRTTSVDAGPANNLQIYSPPIGNLSAHPHRTSNASSTSPPHTPASSQLSWTPGTSVPGDGMAGPSNATAPTSPPARSSTSKFIFSPLPFSSGAATVLIPAPASATSTLDDARPLYHISVTSPASIFYPKSWSTMVRRGGSSAAGEIVAEWTVGMGDQSVVRMGDLEMGIYYAFEGSPKGGKRIWKFNPSARLVWLPRISTRQDSSDKLFWVCKLCKTASNDVGTDIAAFEPTRTYTPAVLKDRDHRSQTVIAPKPAKVPVPPTLEVGEAGLRHLDEVVVSVLISEQMRLTPGSTP